MKAALTELGVLIGAGLMLIVGALVAVAITSAPLVFSVVCGLWIAKFFGIL